MNIENIMAVILALMGAGAVSVWLYWDFKYKKDLKELDALMRRNDMIPSFRIGVLTAFGIEAYNDLPSYEEMLHDGKDLTFKNYVNVNRFINLN